MKKITTMSELENFLSGFTGTEHYYKAMFNGVVFTDGIKALADSMACYWLIDAIVSYQGETAIKAEGFQIWTLTVKDDNSAILTCKTDTNEPLLVSQMFDYTDFVVGELKLYCIDNVILLPSEY